MCRIRRPGAQGWWEVLPVLLSRDGGMCAKWWYSHAQKCQNPTINQEGFHSSLSSGVVFRFQMLVVGHAGELRAESHRERNINNVQKGELPRLRAQEWCSVDQPGEEHPLLCASFVRSGNARKGHHLAHITLPDRHIWGGVPVATRSLFSSHGKSGATLRRVSYQL